jgi:hypothetical protein
MSAIELLNAKRATPETLLEVMVTSIGELSGDLTEAQMRNAILTAGVSEAEFSRLRLELEHAPMLVGEAALAWISSMSHDPDVAEAIESAINDADRNAVLFETTALTIVALYGMYLLATRGATESEKKIERRKDGTYVETEKVVYDTFSNSLKTAFNLFMSQIRPEAKGDS